MFQISLLFRLGVLIFLIGFPISCIGAILIGIPGAVIGFFIAVLCVMYVAVSSEKLIAKTHKAGKEIPKGLARSLELVMSQQIDKKAPKVLIFGDPSPNALIVKSWFGNGTILLSQGLIALLNEEELRAILRLCLQRLWEKGTAFQSLCVLLALFTWNFAPSSWTRLFFAGRALKREDEFLLSPASSIRFIALFPLAQFCIKLGQIPYLGKRPVPLSGPDSVAVQKVVQAIHIWGPGRFHGSFGLYFIHPVTGEILLPHVSA